MNRKLPTANREADIWARLLRSQKAELSTEAAEFLMAISFDEMDRRRMLELADRSEAGTLTADERTEFDKLSACR